MHRRQCALRRLRPAPVGCRPDALWRVGGEVAFDGLDWRLPLKVSSG